MKREEHLEKINMMIAITAALAIVIIMLIYPSTWETILGKISQNLGETFAIILIVVVIYFIGTEAVMRIIHKN